ncbi:MAG: TIGR03087 family PEP-CTERM/XrtA system glycosyltransferase [Gammaproteobacteria bacterium]
MASVLLLVHRLPYPPNKGDKVRSYHLLEHLAARHSVFLGTFIDDPDDEQHIAKVRGLCADLHISRLEPRYARLRSLAGLLHNEPLTLRYYRDAALAAWASDLCRRGVPDSVVVFSSSMAQYASGCNGPRLVDFVDVDSAKWIDYAPTHPWPLSWLYRREGRCLLAYERRVAAGATRSFFVTQKEADLFRSLAPECSPTIEAMSNGVDADYFAPDSTRPSPFTPDELPLVFTGAMDYWPNVDAVSWFVSDVLPRLRRQWPALRFHIVGRSPTAAVRGLAGEAVNVTGTVADVRPYLEHARIVVAPLRLARGLQNKVLEAMAMARPVVAASSCAEAIDAVPGVHLLQAESVDDYVREVAALLSSPDRARAIGGAGRDRVRAVYHWDACLAGIDQFLDAPNRERALA